MLTPLFSQLSAVGCGCACFLSPSHSAFSHTSSLLLAFIFALRLGFLAPWLRGCLFAWLLLRGLDGLDGLTGLVAPWLPLLGAFLAASDGLAGLRGCVSARLRGCVAAWLRAAA